MPECPGFTIASSLDGEAISLTAQDDSACSDSEVRYGDPKVEADFEQLGGYFQLDPVNQGMLARLLPTLVHIRSSDPAADSIKRTIDLIVEEATANHPGRSLVVDRLIEILLVKSLRYDIERIREINQPGLALGLLDPALARALRQLHHDVARQWTVDSLAREAGLSRSSFSQRFSQRVGVPPMQYLIDWRMALAKAMLKGDSPPLEVVAGAIGYQSASAFSTAFRREIGCSPTEFSRGAID
jgi:AraC-like DNA-binding protein